MYASRFSRVIRPLVGGRPTLVLGSAPNPHVPPDYDPATWSLVCINASGRIAEQLDLGTPAITIMASGFLTAANDISVEARQLVSGLRTETLIIRFAGSDPFKRLRRALSVRLRLMSMDYRFERLVFISPAVWRPILSSFREMLDSQGSGNTENVSTGVFGCVMALDLDALTLAVSGIDPASSGHAYNNLDRTRHHVFADEWMLKLLEENWGVRVMAAGEHDRIRPTRLTRSSEGIAREHAIAVQPR
jgi:hypothetical protein